MINWQQDIPLYNSVCNHTYDSQIGLPFCGCLILFIPCMITDRIGLWPLSPITIWSPTLQALHNMGSSVNPPNSSLTINYLQNIQLLLHGLGLLKTKEYFPCEISSTWSLMQFALFFFLQNIKSNQNPMKAKWKCLVWLTFNSFFSLAQIWHQRKIPLVNLACYR